MRADVIDNAESARLVASHSARYQRVPTNLRSRFSPEWQEIALDVEPAKQDQSLDLLECEASNVVGKPATIHLMRCALKRARR